SPRPPRAERARRPGRRSPAGAPRTQTAPGATDSGPTEDRRRRRRRGGGRPARRGTAAPSPPLYQSLHAEKQAGPGLPPGPPCCVTTRLELVPHASRSDDHVLHTLVHRLRRCTKVGSTRAAIVPAGVPVPKRRSREQVAAGQIQRQAGSEPIRQREVDFGTEVAAVTLRPAVTRGGDRCRLRGAGPDRLPAEPVRLDTAVRDEEAVRVDRLVRPGG